MMLGVKATSLSFAVASVMVAGEMMCEAPKLHIQMVSSSSMAGGGDERCLGACGVAAAVGGAVEGVRWDIATEVRVFIYGVVVRLATKLLKSDGPSLMEGSATRVV
jgi:hypothetical protein